MKFLRRYFGVVLAMAMFAGLLPAASLRPGGSELAAIAVQPQASSTPRPTYIRPTRRPTQTFTPTAFRPQPPTRTATRTLPPSPTPEPPANSANANSAPLPASARVEGLVGYGQSLPLSCEARSAVDWARFFGVEIGELVFFNRLPVSDDPEAGFVGSPYGAWGQIPPSSYGVHAGPVAALLREYGLQAQAVRGMTIQEALAEIAAGRPLVVWVTGHVEPGRGVEITVRGETRRVARYEHTVILIGYDDNRDVVIVQDGARVYERSMTVFLKAWEPLENMAVIYSAGASQ